jgi:hypothetical protein
MPPDLQEVDNSGQPPVPPEVPRAPFVPETHVPEKKGSIDNSIELSQLWKAIPRTTDWETFSGEGEYNHDLFIKQVDLYAQDYFMKDYMIVSRLGILLTKTAKNWYIHMRESNGTHPWEWWKDQIRKKFGTSQWKWKMQTKFEKDYYDNDLKSVHTWFGT